MKRGRRAYKEEAQRRLLDVWVGSPAFGEPKGCVATTYTFHAPFFEEHLLSRFLRIENDATEDARSYVIEREERLANAFACVLVDRAHVSTQRSLRWHLLPVTVEGGGIFHPKVAILVWEKTVRLIVASANLTEPGYRKNYENLAVLDFSPQGDVPLSLLHDAIKFMRAARALTPAAPDGDGPVAALDEFLRGIEGQVRSWAPGAWKRGAPRCHFVPVLPGEPTLFQRLSTFWSGPPVDCALVTSPFFSGGKDLARTLGGLDDLLVKRGARTIGFFGRGHRLPDGTVELDMPAGVCRAEIPSLHHTVGFVPLVDEESTEKETRDLHAKSLHLTRDDRGMYLIGSSNFTSAGTGVGPIVNVEANVAYELPDLSDRFAKICEEARPPTEVVDLENDKVVFRHDQEDRTPDDERYALLPGCFGAALLHNRGVSQTIELAIKGTPPQGFVVYSPAGTPLLDENAWTVAEQPPVTALVWADPRPPTYLTVRWTDPEGAREALWIINVADISALPPPEEMRNLALGELLEVLTSALPYHETVARIMRRRETGQGANDSDVIVDPHKKVEAAARNFLLRRMKRISLALEGLKERLERPVMTLDGLRWRLHGPFGPVVLARRLAAEEGEGAAFMIAEVAATVRDAQIRTDEGVVPKAVVKDEKGAVMSTLRTLAAEREAPRNLKDYVNETFAELLP